MSEQNYIISTPEHRKSTQLCHVNLLKPYFASALQSSACSDHPTISHTHAACVADSTVSVKADGRDIEKALDEVEQMSIDLF